MEQSTNTDGPVLELSESVSEGLSALLEVLEPILGKYTDSEGQRDWPAVSAEVRTLGEQLRVELLAEFEPFDAFDVLANILRLNSVVDPNRYRESEHDGRLVNVEYAAALLLPREGRRGDPDLRNPVDVGQHARSWSDRITQLLNLRWFQHLADLHTEEPRLARVQHDQFQLEMTVRNACYDFQEERHLRALFGGDAVSADLVNAVGFTIDECLRMVELCDQHVGHALAAGARAGAALAAEARAHLDTPDSADVNDEVADLAERMAALDPDDHGMAMQVYAMGAGWTELGDRAAFTADDLAAWVPIEPAAAQSFLDLFSQPFGTDAHADPVRALQQIKARPILRAGDEFFSLAGGDLLFAVRETLERALKEDAQKAWERYERHRGRWVAGQVAELLGGVLEPELLEEGVTWTVGEDRYEMDVLAVVDRTAITVEVKAGGFTERARRADPDRLRRDIDRLVGDAHEQAGRAADALNKGIELRDAAGSVLAVGHVTNVIPMVVTLDELTVVAPQVWALARDGLLGDDAPPTTMALSELEIVTHILTRPARLIHYLTRRARVDERGGLAAHEEADLLMHYLRQGLYLEDIPDNVTQILESQTDDLDSYFYYRYGNRDRPADKPQPRLHAELQAVVDVLEQHRPDGWLTTIALFLDMSEDAQNDLGSHILTIKQSSRESGVQRNLTVAIDDFKRGITIVTAGAGDPTEIATWAEFLATKNKYMHHAVTWTALGFDVTDPDRTGFIHLLLDEPWEQDDALDELAEEDRRRTSDGTLTRPRIR